MVWFSEINYCRVLIFTIDFYYIAPLLLIPFIAQEWWLVRAFAPHGGSWRGREREGLHNGCIS